jgi:hypothetical protein
LADIDADHGDRGIGCLRHGVLLVFGAPCQLRLLAGQEHGRTIPLGDISHWHIRSVPCSRHRSAAIPKHDRSIALQLYRSPSIQSSGGGLAIDTWVPFPAIRLSL